MTNLFELFEEKICSKCGESWPADSEFFYRYHGQIVNPCKACVSEAKTKARKRKIEREKALQNETSQIRKTVHPNR